MKTMGRSTGWSDVATIGVSFPYPSTRIYVSGIAGNIVYMNTNGVAQYLPNAQQYAMYDIAATQIVETAVVNGVSRSTTATEIVYLSSNIYS